MKYSVIRSHHLIDSPLFWPLFMFVGHNVMEELDRVMMTVMMMTVMMMMIVIMTVKMMTVMMMTVLMTVMMTVMLMTVMMTVMLMTVMMIMKKTVMTVEFVFSLTAGSI